MQGHPAIVGGISLDDTFASTSESVSDALPSISTALYSLKTTRYANSFASRLYGFASPYPGVESITERYIYRDWETRSPWVLLMNDLKAHHQFRKYALNTSPSPAIE